MISLFFIPTLNTMSKNYSDQKLGLNSYSTYTDIGWHLDQINITGAWDYTIGSKDIVVAVIDSGIDWVHTQINNTWKNLGEVPSDGLDNDGNGYIDDYQGWDFVSNDSQPGPEAADPIHEHATYITGIIAAQLDNVGVAGVAPNVTVMDIRVLNSTNFLNTTLEWFGEAIKYAVDNGADVINLSIQDCLPSSFYLDDIQYAVNNNVPVVSVTGNTWSGGIDYPSYPGAYDEVISIGATNYFYQRADYSNFGLPWTELMAPVGDGEIIIPSQTINSTLPPPLYYGNRVGTSFAAPQVASVIALMRTINYSMPVSEIRNILQTTAYDIMFPGHDVESGYGLVNATAAVKEVYDRTYPAVPEFNVARMSFLLIIIVTTIALIPILAKKQKNRTI